MSLEDRIIHVIERAGLRRYNNSCDLKGYEVTIGLTTITSSENSQKDSH